MDITQQRALDNQHFVHPWEGMADYGQQERTFAQSAEGIYVQDENGRKLIDGPGGMWCMQIGYGRKEMADAIAAQVMQTSYYSPWNLTAQPATQLAGKIAELTPGDLNHVFFTTGGSTAVDSALRFVHFYNNVLGRPEKKVVISRQQAYHGSSYLAASVSGKERDRSFMDTSAELSHFLPHVNPFRRPGGQSIEQFCTDKVNDLEQAILTLGPERVGAFIAEPILASGGVVIPPPGYHKRCLEVCHKYDVLYVSDEVVTAFGRLGHWFSSESVFDIQPDIITSAKGITSGYVPLGACIVSDRLMQDLHGHKATFSNGYTYSGHPVSCAAALKNIEIMERENILQHVQEITPYFQQRLEQLRELPIVCDVRGVGLIGCVECSLEGGDGTLKQDQELGYKIDEHCQKLGLIVRPINNMCVFSPPLVISKEQIDEMMDLLEQGIRSVMTEI